ncbi:MAG: ArsI/CadI family heavy metal resistance metalloenzyme [Cyanobacteria bacterium P01_F01_bin.53]
MNTFKTHIALKVSELERSVAFYQSLFNTQPVKHKAGYAKFDIENPALNLTLNESDGQLQRGSLSHLGIQVSSTQAVLDTVTRLKAAGLNPTEEFNTDCCYALQDKAWVRDPDDHRWEIFVVHVDDTAPELNIDPVAKVPQLEKAAADRSCCVPTCCT